MRPYRMVPLLLVALIASGCSLVSGGTTDPSPSASPTGPLVRVGAGPEQESLLLADVMAVLLRDGGFRPEVVPLANGAAVRDAIEVGDIDLAPGYTGEAWLEVLGRANPPSDPRTSFARVRSYDESTNAIRWLRPAFEVDDGIDGPPADATFGLWVRGVPSADADLRTIAQLATRLAEQEGAGLPVCVDEEFATRPDGWEALARAYSIAATPAPVKGAAEAVAGVATGQCLAGLSTTTDGDAWHAGLVLLADPLEVFPAFVVTAQVRLGMLQDHPRIEDVLAPLTAGLTTRMLGTWNGQLVGGLPREEVARTATDVLLEAAGREPLAVPSPSG